MTEENLQPELIFCACGCGILISKKGNRYINHHNAKGKHNPNFKHDKTNNNKCEICQKRISFLAKRCNLCAGDLRGRLGVKMNEATKRLISSKAKERFKTPEDHPCFKHGKSKCLDCGKELYNYSSKRCRKCNYNYIKKEGKLKGKNNGAYVHGEGYKPYIYKFNKELKEKIRKRDTYTCQLCGIGETENKRKLSIHHIDYNKKNCEECNLISLCQKCNSFVNSERKKWERHFKKEMKNGTRKNTRRTS